MYELRPFRLLAADLSLRRPAFAVLGVDPTSQKIQIVELLDINNRRKSNPHGHMMNEILDMVADLCMNVDLCVRECAYIAPNSERTIFEVQGVAELALWRARHSRFFDIVPAQVKLLVAGREKANKAHVARALERYVGPRTYSCDGQSDAVAVGIAWLKRGGILTDTGNGWRINHMLDSLHKGVTWEARGLYEKREEACAVVIH